MDAIFSFMVNQSMNIAEKQREAVITKVRDTYKNPPVLASRYPSIYEVPLENRLRRTTTQLTEWSWLFNTAKERISAIG